MNKSLRILAALGLALVATMPTAFAQLNVPSDGSDGVLNITSNTVIDLSLASTNGWDADNSARAGLGVYDSNKWAVVFKYSSVNIGVGSTVTFKNHRSYAPVVWLVQSNVTINGIVSLDSVNGTSAVPDSLSPTEPGPGGFRGGAIGPSGIGSGFGPGGGGLGFSTYRSSYGNPQILPLIGGSGSGGHTTPGRNGPSGGGAILIVASGSATIGGKVTAKPAQWVEGIYDSTSAGGAIKIIANQILGTGTIDAERDGRTRMEANLISSQLNIFPNTVAVPPGPTPVIWPPSNIPTVRVVSVDGQPAPVDPSAALSTSSDIGMQNNSPVDIILETKNFPIQGIVALRIGPKYAAAYWLNATYVSGNLAQATWKVTTTLPSAFCVLQARATAP